MRIHVLKRHFLHIVAMLKVRSSLGGSGSSGSGGNCRCRRKLREMKVVQSWTFTWPRNTPKEECNWNITSVPKSRNNKVINDEGAVTIYVPNWVTSVNVEIPDTNIKYCSHLIVKDDSGMGLFEAVNLSNIMVIDGDYGSFKP